MWFSFFLQSPPNAVCFQIRLWWEKSKVKMLNIHEKVVCEWMCVCLCSCRTFKAAFVCLMIIVIWFLSAVGCRRGRVLSVNDIIVLHFWTHNFGYLIFCCHYIYIAVIVTAAAAAAVDVVIKHRLQWNSTQFKTNTYTHTDRNHCTNRTTQYMDRFMLKLNDK